MFIKPIQQPTFNGYQSRLKTLWKQGQLPTVKRGLYGDILTHKNLSLEHLKPHSKGGKTVLSNLALASKAKNSARSSEPLKKYLTQEMIDNYLKQFENVYKRGFSGNKYIEMLRKTIKELLK